MTREEFLQEIKRAKEENRTEFSIIFEGITELPKEIAQLTNLQILSLDWNKLTGIPKEIKQLTNLQLLSLDGNQLAELPREIVQLTELRSLSLDWNDLTELPAEIAQLTNLQTLYLSNNKLTELPAEIAQLTNLQSLFLSNNKLTELPREIVQLTKLLILNFNGNQLAELPREIVQLTELRSLSLNGNQLTELPREVVQLTNLESLSLDANQLTKLPREVVQLTELRSLSLDANQLTKLPREVVQLTELRSLSINGNQLTELPREVVQLTNLQSLSINGNQLAELPREVVQLTELRSLSLNGNQLTELPREVVQLTNLQSLSLNRNQLTELPREIVQLTELESLYIDGNQLTEFPNEITQLPKLESLYIDESQLKKFTKDLLKLKNLKLEIRNGNDYQAIPAEILANINTAQELLDYYAQTQKGEARELNEAKVLVVGQGSVGKTSLIKMLLGKGYNPKENKTDGIDIYKELKVPVNDRVVQLNIWDFGGQEIMHATHQFFLTKRSLYLLVLDARLDREENRIDYWLEKIKILGGESPVMIVGNKIDQHQFDINQGGLAKKYPNIKGFYPISCETQKNFTKLRESLIEEIGKLNGIHDSLPASWFAVKEELEKIDKNYISYEKYEEICAKHEVVEPENQSRLVKLLNDLGIALNFSDDVRLQDTNVLNPEWVTQGVYKILNSRELFKKKGELQLSTLTQILDTRLYPKTKYLFIIDMMRKFELCFDIVENEKFLVPDLLSEEELNTGDWKDSLKFEYHYPIFFNSIITRFIVKMHEKISRATYWRTGVVLEYRIDGEAVNEALVKADTADKKVFIYIRGNKQTRREFLSLIREKFEEIHRSFSKEFAEEKVAEKVPVPQNPSVVVDYKNLLRHEKIGKKSLMPEGMEEEVFVTELLSGIETKEESAGRIRDLPAPVGTSAAVSAATKADIDRKNELELEKVRLDAKAEKNWMLIKVLICIPAFAGLCLLGYLIIQNWEKINQNLQSAHIILVIFFTIIVGAIVWLFGGKKELEKNLNRFGEIRDEKLRESTYRWNNFDIAEYREICRRLENKETK